MIFHSWQFWYSTGSFSLRNHNNGNSNNNDESKHENISLINCLNRCDTKVYDISNLFIDLTNLFVKENILRKKMIITFVMQSLIH